MKRNIFLLISLLVVNNLGDIIFDMFITRRIGSDTGNIVNAVYLIGSSMAFRALLSFFAGSITDKYPKKKMIILSHISSLVLISIFGLFRNLTRERLSIGILFVLLNDINNELFSRNYISMTSSMLDELSYIKFQSYSNIALRVISTGGAIFAGTIIDRASFNMVMTIDILTYLLSLLFISKVNFEEEVPENLGEGKVRTLLVADVKFTAETISKSSYLLSFIILMFVLNLAYGYIPSVLPIIKANKIDSATYLGLFKSSIALGEIAGLALVFKTANRVSGAFRISMVLNILIILSIYATDNPIFLIISFALYGFSDALTQPLFGYTVSNLDKENRGKILGGIDAIIMFSPSIGIYLITALSKHDALWGGIFLALIFLTGLILVTYNKDMKDIRLDSEKLP